MAELDDPQLFADYLESLNQDQNWSLTEVKQENAMVNLKSDYLFNTLIVFNKSKKFIEELTKWVSMDKPVTDNILTKVILHLKRIRERCSYCGNILPFKEGYIAYGTSFYISAKLTELSCNRSEESDKKKDPSKPNEEYCCGKCSSCLLQIKCLRVVLNMMNAIESTVSFEAEAFITRVCYTAMSSLDWASNHEYFDGLRISPGIATFCTLMHSELADLALICGPPAASRLGSIIFMYGLKVMEASLESVYYSPPRFYQLKSDIFSLLLVIHKYGTLFSKGRRAMSAAIEAISRRLIIFLAIQVMPLSYIEPFLISVYNAQKFSEDLVNAWNEKAIEKGDGKKEEEGGEEEKEGFVEKGVFINRGGGGEFSNPFMRFQSPQLNSSSSSSSSFNSFQVNSTFSPHVNNFINSPNSFNSLSSPTSPSTPSSSSSYPPDSISTSSTGTTSNYPSLLFSQLGNLSLSLKKKKNPSLPPQILKEDYENNKDYYYESLFPLVCCFVNEEKKKKREEKEGKEGDKEERSESSVEESEDEEKKRKDASSLFPSYFLRGTHPTSHILPLLPFERFYELEENKDKEKERKEEKEEERDDEIYPFPSPFHSWDEITKERGIDEMQTAFYSLADPVYLENRKEEMKKKREGESSASSSSSSSSSSSLTSSSSSSSSTSSTSSSSNKKRSNVDIRKAAVKNIRSAEIDWRIVCGVVIDSIAYASIHQIFAQSGEEENKKEGGNEKEAKEGDKKDEKKKEGSKKVKYKIRQIRPLCTVQDICSLVVHRSELQRKIAASTVPFSVAAALAKDNKPKLEMEPYLSKEEATELVKIYKVMGTIDNDESTVS